MDRDKRNRDRRLPHYLHFIAGKLGKQSIKFTKFSLLSLSPFNWCSKKSLREVTTLIDSRQETNGKSTRLTLSISSTMIIL